MKHWQETAAILERITSRADRSGRCALATVVGISGSAYRRPGAKLLVEEGVADLALGARHHAVVQTHSLSHDRDWTAALLQRPLAYLGLLGSRKRARDVLGERATEAAERVFAPVGLDLGADGPEQVAISVVAELLAVRAGRAPTHLRARTGPIHGG